MQFEGTLKKSLAKIPGEGTTDPQPGWIAVSKRGGSAHPTPGQRAMSGAVRGNVELWNLETNALIGTAALRMAYRP